MQLSTQTSCETSIDVRIARGHPPQIRIARLATVRGDFMSARRSVALLIETSNAYARGLMDGIIAYQREHELWSIYVGEQERGARPPRWLRNWNGDGIIARI